MKFSLEFTRDCGAGVAWNYSPACSELYEVTTWDKRGTGEGWGVKVWFSTVTPLARHWAGYLPIFSKDIWLAANTKYNWGYVWPHGPGKDWTWDRMGVRAYHPWEHDANNNDIVDIIEDGTGAYVWVGCDPLMTEWVELEAFRQWYIGPDDYMSYLTDAFHFVGDVDFNRVIDTVDLGRLAHAFETGPGDPQGTGWGQWNPDCDISGAAGAPDDYVDMFDTYPATISYGGNAG